MMVCLVNRKRAMADQITPTEHTVPKRELRREHLARRAQFTAQARLDSGAAVMARLIPFLRKGPLAVVGLYWPIRSEIDLRALAALPELAGVPVGLPRIIEPKARLMDFRHWRPGDPTEAHRFGMSEPMAVAAPLSLIHRDALLLVPCVAIDQGGFRLGYGAGYYDRFLAACHQAGHSGPRTIGVAYECNVVTELPRDATDVPLDLILSEAGLRPRQVAM